MIDARELALAQDRARVTGSALTIDGRFDGATIEDGYAVQRELISINAERSNPLVGWKVAMSNRPAMEKFGLDKPIYAPLFADMRVPDEQLNPARTQAPKLEAEILFVLGKSLTDPLCTEEEILSAIEYIAPAFEVADSRTGWQFDIPTFVADGAVASHYHVGAQVRFDPGFDFERVGCELEADGRVLEGAGGNLIGGPLHSAIAMIRDIVARFGGVKAGQHLLSGSLTQPLNMVAGTRYRLTLLNQTLELNYG